MNIDSLARHYDKLTIWERVAAITAAMDRHDETEVSRLAGSAPRKGWSIPDFANLLQYLFGLADYHALEQLSFAAAYWMGSVAVHVEESMQRRKQLADMLRFLSFRAVGNSDCWTIFCKDLGIDPDALLRGLPGFDLIQQFIERARLSALTLEEAADLIAKCSNGTDGPHRRVTIATPEEEAKSLLAMLKARVH